MTPPGPGGAQVGEPAVGIDIGGTKAAGALVDPGGRILREARLPSPASDAAAIAQTVVRLVTEVAADHPSAPVGVAVAGLVDLARERIMYAPNLAMDDEPLAARLHGLLRRRVVLDNDANAAAWAEYRFGAGQGARVLAMVTLGTGIGGGLVLDGRLVHGGFGAAGEFGHIRLVPQGRRCSCGGDGCWEAYGSGAGLRAAAVEAMTTDPDRAPTLTSLSGGDPARVDGHMVSAAAAAGDPAALEAFAMIAHWNGVGLAAVSAVVDPDLIVVGGGVAESPHVSWELIEDSYRRHLTGVRHRPVPQIRSARWGNLAGVVGAADLARAAMA